MQLTRLVILGGFLGAGKTTLVAKATETLVRRGNRVGLITNDQAANLVDTAVLKAAGCPVQEVSGGCFCCRYDDLIAAMDELIRGGNPHVLIGEPVGSCTDLSATVLQPLKEGRSDRLRVAPFSVLVDVKQVRTLERLRQSLGVEESAHFPENVMYVYRKQLEEADVIVLNKADLLPAPEVAELDAALRREFPQAAVFTISALRGDGVEAWLDFILGDRPAGRTITPVDYEEYAAGEAALGWLNAAVRLRAERPVEWSSFCRGLIEGLQAEFQALSAEVAHLKLHLAADGQSLVANLTSSGGTPSLRGAIEGQPTQATLLVNARVHLDPERLRAIVERQLAVAAGDSLAWSFDDLRSFSPARPQPTHRYDSVV